MRRGHAPPDNLRSTRQHIAARHHTRQPDRCQRGSNGGRTPECFTYGSGRLCTDTSKRLGHRDRRACHKTERGTGAAHCHRPRTSEKGSGDVARRGIGISRPRHGACTSRQAVRRMFRPHHNLCYPQGGDSVEMWGNIPAKSCLRRA